MPDYNSGSAGIGRASVLFRLQRRDAQPCIDLMGGEEAMRRAGYIPRKDRESDRAYTIRVNRTVLRNAFAQTLAYYRGQVFSRDIALDGESSALSEEQMRWFAAWAEDVDRRGRNLTSWSGNVFTAGLVSGVTFALVDYPYVENERLGGETFYRADDGSLRPRTENAARGEGWRPYLVHVPAERVLDCRAEWRGGRRVITHFRYQETRYETTDASPWDVTEVRYVRAYWPDRWELWRSVAGAGAASTEGGAYDLVGGGRLSLDEIPLAVFMPGDERSDFTARPALMDLAWLNIRHWQASCEQEDLMAYARMPVWTVTGAQQELDPAGNPVPVQFGPGNILFLQQGGGVMSVGVDAASVEAGRQNLRDIEDAMATYGLQIMQAQSTARMTATEVEKTSREGNSQLRNWALDFKDFLENVLRFVAQWEGMADGPSAQVNDDYADTASLDSLTLLFDKGVLSRETLAAFAVRLGVLPDDFNYVEEVARRARDMAAEGNAGPSLGASLARRLGVGTAG